MQGLLWCAGSSRRDALPKLVDTDAASVLTTSSGRAAQMVRAQTILHFQDFSTAPRKVLSDFLPVVDLSSIAGALPVLQYLWYYFVPVILVHAHHVHVHVGAYRIARLAGLQDA